MKKMLFGAFLGMFALTGIAFLPNYANAEGGGSTNDSAWINPDGSKNLVNWSQELTWSKLLDTIKNVINWILWILATVALVVCLYGWLTMVLSGGDEKKYGDGLKILKYAAIGLAVIWLSWMIVSVVFWFIANLWEQTKWGTVNGSADGGKWAITPATSS